MPYVVGLTGGIGSGKSAAAQVFSGLGVSVVDTDAIAHQLTVPGGAAMLPLLAEFGPEFATASGALDRKRMREMVFADPAAKRQLESILHPLIRDETEARTQAAGGPYVIQMVPLLVESGRYRERCRRVLVVDCPEQTQIARAMARSQLSESEVRAIMAAQATRGERLAAADDVIDNQGDLAELNAQVVALHARYQQLAAAANCNQASPD
jgi:dephospho-CoA kinase